MRTASIVLACIVAPALAALAILSSGGWGVLLWIPSCALAGAFNLAVHVRAIWQAGASPRLVRLALLSGALLIVAFLLQVDAGDGPSWLIVSPLLSGQPTEPNLPVWWPGWANLAAFLPLIGSWFLVIRETNRA